MKRSRRRMYVIAAVVVVLLAVAGWAYAHYEPSVSLDRVLDLYESYGYFVIFVPVMLETAGVPLPGETILLLSGVAASTGRIDPWIAIAVGSAAAATPESSRIVSPGSGTPAVSSMTGTKMTK